MVTIYTIFAIELASRRVQILGSTSHPDEAFMGQVARTLTMGEGDECRVLICDRDAKWSEAVSVRLHEAGLRVIQTPYRAPNADTHAERFVRSIKEECLKSVDPLGEGHFRRTVAEFAAHYHRERNHQGLGNEMIDGWNVPVLEVNCPDLKWGQSMGRRVRSGRLIVERTRALQPSAGMEPSRDNRRNCRAPATDEFTGRALGLQDPDLGAPVVVMGMIIGRSLDAAQLLEDIAGRPPT